MEGTPAVRAEHVSVRYGSKATAVHALSDVSLAVPSGAWTTVMGASGSGKTTLLHVLSGLRTPTEGRVYVGDTDISALSEAARARLRRTEIGVVFQEFNLIPVLNVRDNLLLPLRLAHRRVDDQWFDHVISVLGLHDRLRHMPHELSGGQRQRVAVGRAVLARPRIIFADEPTGNLDSDTTHSVLGMFRTLVDDLGQTLLLITHDPEASAYGDGLVTMRDGRIIS